MWYQEDTRRHRNKASCARMDAMQSIRPCWQALAARVKLFCRALNMRREAAWSVRRTCVGRLSPRCAAMKVVSSRTAASDVGFAAFVDGA
jgi:hypothetical protein